MKKHTERIENEFDLSKIVKAQRMFYLQLHTLFTDTQIKLSKEICFLLEL